MAMGDRPRTQEPEPYRWLGSGEKDDGRHVLLRGGPSRTRVTGKIPEFIFRQVHFVGSTSAVCTNLNYPRASRPTPSMWP
jgi:hypothetical protein